MTRETPHWKIEIRAARWPVEVWEIITLVSGRLAKYVDRGDAEIALLKMQKVQPHAMLRISQM
jgi:hypothetical protein